MPGKYHTYCTFRNKAAANRMAAYYRKQMGLGLDGKPRRYGKPKKVKAPNAAGELQTPPNNQK